MKSLLHAVLFIFLFAVVLTLVACVPENIRFGCADSDSQKYDLLSFAVSDLNKQGNAIAYPKKRYLNMSDVESN